MDIFPIIQPDLYEVENDIAKTNVNIDVLWDENGPVIENGRPVIVEGKQAAIGWARRCLLTKKNEFEIFSSAYGCEIEELIGKRYQQSTIEAEAVRIIEEALLANEFITGVSDIKVNFEGSTLKILCKVKLEEEEAEISI